MSKTRNPQAGKSSSVTGKYVYDAATDSIVKVSDKTPKLASRGSSMQAGPCGRTQAQGCGGGGGACGV